MPSCPARLLLSALALISVICANGAVAAEAAARPMPRPLFEYFRETWSSRDGLPHNLINDAAQTDDGYLWFATWEGAVRYNGKEFLVFDRERVAGLRDHGVRALAADSKGGIWLGTSRGGVAHYRNGRWSWIGVEQGLAQDEVMDLAVAADGALWVGLESAGLDRVGADGRVSHFGRDNGLPDDVVYAIAHDVAGRTWVGTAGGLGVVDGKRVRRIGAETGLGESVVFSLYADQRGGLLVGTEDGAFSLRGERFERIEGLPRDPVQRLYRDRDGDVWVGTVNHGVLRVSARGVERLGVESGLPNVRVAALLEDREGSLWIGTNGGLLRLRDAPFSNLAAEHGLSGNYVRSLLERPDGSLWVGSSSGLDRVVDGQSSPLPHGADAPIGSVLSMAPAADGGVWIGTYASGVLHWRDDRVVDRIGVDQGISANQVRAVLQTRDGGLWIGTNRGLTRRLGSEVMKLGIDDGLPREFIIALYQDRRGALWVATANGLAVIDDPAAAQPAARAISQDHDAFGLAEDQDGVLWVATDRGMARVRGDRLDWIGFGEGLPVETVFQVVPDRIGNLWLSSNRGVIRVPRDEAIAVADGTRSRVNAERFGELDGMASAQCNGGSGPVAIRRRDGSLSIGTAMGVASVHPEQLPQFARHVPPVVIESVRVDDVVFPLGGELDLPAGTRRIEIGYAGLSYLMPQKIEYRYRLDGFDQGWIDTGNLGSAQFTNLAPGDYRFRVIAANPNGQWSGEPATLKFRVQSFIWQRPVFWGGLVIIAGLALALGYRWRVRQLRRAEIQLRELVERRTADLRKQTERLIDADQEKSRLLDRLQAQAEAFERQAREDALTGLPNRRAFDEELARAFARSQRSGSPLTMALIDVDWFKRINDGYSHAAGDAALKAVARVLREQVRVMDSVARYGGEEFAVLCPDTRLESALEVCERIREGMSRIDCSAFAPGWSLSVSIGVAEATGLSHHERLVSRADAAMYRAKDAGRNRVCS